jgi:hypothetical protein
LGVEKLAYAGWPNCYRLTDGEVELVVTTDVGPRIIRYGFVGGQNLFWENQYQAGKSGEAYWQMRGGHRLWVAPEIVLVTYALDNGPIDGRITENSVAVAQRAPIQKEMIITLLKDGRVEILHALKNCGNEVVQLAAWPVSVMAQGGLAIAAFPKRCSHEESFLPTNPLVMWAYTDFSDNRWMFTHRYVMLRQNTAVSRPQKAGLFNECTFAAYLLGTELFVKQCRATREATYPDFGSSFEMFTNNDFLELETLGPLVRLAPGESTTHTEHWSLHRGVQFESLCDDELDRVLGPLMMQ